MKSIIIVLTLLATIACVTVANAAPRDNDEKLLKQYNLAKSEGHPLWIILLSDNRESKILEKDLDNKNVPFLEPHHVVACADKTHGPGYAVHFSNMYRNGKLEYPIIVIVNTKSMKYVVKHGWVEGDSSNKVDLKFKINGMLE